MQTREIPLTQGQIAIVDEADYEELAQYKWQAVAAPNTFYAKRDTSRRFGRRKVSMHRQLVPDTERVDHRDGDGLNNTRANLRAASHAENMRNRRGPQANNTSGFIGVSWHKGTEKWRACIQKDGRQVHVGLFPSAKDAARARDVVALATYGEFASLNFPEGVA